MLLISYEDFQRFQQLQEEQVIDRFDQLLARLARQNVNFSDEEIEADLQTADDEMKARR